MARNDLAKKKVTDARYKSRPAFKASAKARRYKASKIADVELVEILKRYIRLRGAAYLEDPNITSIGVGQKNGTGEVCLQFTVARKGERGISAIDTQRIPAKIDVNGHSVRTDVVERIYHPSYQVVEARSTPQRKTRVDPIQPGYSISHYSLTAGTIGLIVFARSSKRPCILSCWHVIYGPNGKEHDSVVQPGVYDMSNYSANICAGLKLGHLGEAGDCAIAEIIPSSFDPKARGFNREIFGLGITPGRIADVHLNDHVIKSSRTTGVTHGIVCRPSALVQISYGAMGMRNIGCFEIKMDPAHPPETGSISQPGDSGAAWMISENGQATDIFAGLHFSGDFGTNSQSTALACSASSIQVKLDFVLAPPT